MRIEKLISISVLIARAISASSQKISHLLQSYEELINTGPARGGLVFHIERPARDWRSPTERVPIPRASAGSNFTSSFREPNHQLPSGKPRKNDGKSPFLIGKSTISMAIFNSFLYVYRRVKPSTKIRVHNLPMGPQGDPWDPVGTPDAKPFSFQADAQKMLSS